MHLDVEWVHEGYNKFKKSGRLECTYEKVNSSKETGRSWYRALDTTYVHIFVKFKRRFSIQFVRKKEKQNFLQKDGSTHFFVKNDLFLRTEMDNLRSNFTENIMQCISID
jgi:hypothetical protein